MMRRLAIVAAAAVATFGVLLAVANGWGAFDPPTLNPEIRPAPIGPADWKETRRYTVNRVVVIEGESAHPERAPEIARELMEPISGLYDEVLIYVRPSTALGAGPSTPPGTNAARPRTWRVQWTKAGGFRVLQY